MRRSLGMVEYRTVSAGLRAADLIAKAAEVDLLEARIVSPGKYLLMLSGELGAVQAAVEASREQIPNGLIDTFILGNPHPDIFPAIRRQNTFETVEALGIIETFTAASAIKAADAAAKSAIVRLMDIRIENEMCGKALVLFTGSIANVTEAGRIARLPLETNGTLLDYAVIPHPDEKLWQTLRDM